jgi:hypothetical protein
MSMDGQKAIFNLAPTAPDSGAELPAGSERCKTRFGFNEKDFIVYPAHVGVSWLIDKKIIQPVDRG